MSIFTKNWGLFLVLLLSWWAITPFFHPGFFTIHDDTQVVRVYEMAQSLKDGQFPVRWVADLGYGFGYPLFNFYAPLPYYIGSFFNLIGFDVLSATKAMFIVGILLAGLFMYFLSREFFGELGGVLAGVFYLYAPYHALDIYVRGAVGEFWAMAFLPLSALGLYRVALAALKNSNQKGDNLKFKIKNLKLQFKNKNDMAKAMILGVIGLAGIILSHNLTAMMVAPFLIIAMFLYCYIAYKQKKLLTISYLLFTIFLSVGLSAFYWLPAISEMQFTNVSSQIGGGADFRDHFVCLGQLWSSTWGFGGSAPGCIADGMSFQIGKLQVMLIPVIIFLFFGIAIVKRSFNSIHPRKSIVFMAFLGFLISIFFTLEMSKPVWELVKAMAYIQYPWRFLALATFFVSILAASVIVFFQNRFLKLLICAALLGMILPYRVKYFQPQKYLNLQAKDFTTEENIKWKTSKISDEFLPPAFPKPQRSDNVVKEKISSFDKSVNISNLMIKSDHYSFNVTSGDVSLFLARAAYFPGWTIFVDGREKLFMAQNGQMVFSVPKGTHQVEIILKNTLVRTVGNILSFLSVVILIGGVIYVRKVKS